MFVDAIFTFSHGNEIVINEVYQKATQHIDLTLYLDVLLSIIGTQHSGGDLHNKSSLHIL